MFAPWRARTIVNDGALAGVAGFVLAYRIDRLDRPQGQLLVYEVAVLPEFQRQGIGTRLMEEIRRIVTDEHLMEAFVVTDRVNQSAWHLFDRTGAYVEASESERAWSF